MIVAGTDVKQSGCVSSACGQTAVIVRQPGLSLPRVLCRVPQGFPRDFRHRISKSSGELVFYVSMAALGASPAMCPWLLSGHHQLCVHGCSRGSSDAQHLLVHVCYVDIWWSCNVCWKVEFEDHQLIKRRKAANGVEVLYVPMERGALQQLLRDMEKV